VPKRTLDRDLLYIDRVIRLGITFAIVWLAGEVHLAQAQSFTTSPPAITALQRVEWFTSSTVGPSSLIGGAFSAGFGTLVDRPREYDTHWQGFGQRYGIRLTGIVTSNAMEAGLGSIWREDPRYDRLGTGRAFKTRLKHTFVMTVMARNGRNRLMPAFGRYAAISGSNFLSNNWRESSEATNSAASLRIGLGFLGRMAGNMFSEFWPDAKQKLFHHQ